MKSPNFHYLIAPHINPALCPQISSLFYKSYTQSLNLHNIKKDQKISTRSLKGKQPVIICWHKGVAVYLLIIFVSVNEVYVISKSTGYHEELYYMAKPALGKSM